MKTRPQRTAGRMRFLSKRDEETLERIAQQQNKHFDAETMSSARTHNEVDIDRSPASPAADRR